MPLSCPVNRTSESNGAGGFRSEKYRARPQSSSRRRRRCRLHRALHPGVKMRSDEHPFVRLLSSANFRDHVFHVFRTPMRSRISLRERQGPRRENAETPQATARVTVGGPLTRPSISSVRRRRFSASGDSPCALAMILAQPARRESPQ